jgi:AcrR family transcriptional regulator
MSKIATGRIQTERLSGDRYSEAQRRTIDAALELFAVHGVSGTSFQMIADAVGVTKAAIYFQFKTKAALVHAAAEVGLAPLEVALDEAEDETRTKQAREVLLRHVIDLAVSRRRWAAALLADPVMGRLLVTHDPFVDLMTRVYAVLLGIDADPAARVRTAIVAGAMAGATAHPLVADLDADRLRAELMAVARRLFDLGN